GTRVAARQDQVHVRVTWSMSSSPLSYGLTIAITKSWTSSVPVANRSGAKAVMKAFVRVFSEVPSTRVMFAGTPSRVVASYRLRMLPFSTKYESARTSTAPWRSVPTPHASDVETRTGSTFTRP